MPSPPRHLLRAWSLALALALPAATAAQPAPAPAAGGRDVRERIREAAARDARVAGAAARAADAGAARALDEADRRAGVFEGGAGLRYFPERERLLARDPAAYLEARRAALGRMESAVSGPVALAVSGGTSLGAYEAGVLYHYTYTQARWEELRRRPGAAGPRAIPVDALPRFSVVAGASAGGINAFFAAIAACERPVDDPQDSLFRLWVEVDWRDLVGGAEDENRCEYFEGALTRARLVELLEQVRARWVDSPRWTACDVDFAVAVSHLFPRAIPLSPPEEGAVSTVQLARLTERFVIHLQGREGRPPVITVLTGAETGVDDAFQPTIGRPPPPPRPGPERELADVTPLLLATSGIPGVFDPLPLDHAYGAGATVQRSCFIDGGVLDNVPLSTAIRLVRHRQEARRRARERAGAPAGSEPAPVYVYVDADNTEHARAPAAPGKAPLAAYGALLGGLVTGARQAELVRAVEENPQDRRAMMLPYRKHVITGEVLNAFGAFFDESFRRYDFLAGMADVERSMEHALHFEEVRRAGLLQLRAPGLDCFRAVWAAADRDGERATLGGPACTALRDAPGEDREAAIRRDLWRLLTVTTALDRGDPHLARTLLERLGRVEGARVASTGKRRGYEYVTLRRGGRLAGPDAGLAAVREQLQELVHRFAARPGGPVLATAVNEVANGALEYRKVTPFAWLGVYGRGPEAGAAIGLGRLPADLALGLQVPDFALGHGEGQPWRLDVRAALTLRLEWAPLTWLQLQPGLALVGQSAYSGSRSAAQRLGVGPRLDVQVVQRLYGTVAWTAFPSEAAGWPRSDLAFGLGVRFWR